MFSVLRKDEIALKCLRAVQQYGPDNAYIAAGFLRNRYWDQLYDDHKTISDTDVDVVYFDPEDTSRDAEHAFEDALLTVMPDQQWQVRNQARMHAYGDHEPFKNLSDALMHWPEVATAVGVRVVGDDTLEYIAPFGLADLYDHILRITPVFKEKDPASFEKRLVIKGWKKRWPRLCVVRG